MTYYNELFDQEEGRRRQAQFLPFPRFRLLQMTNYECRMTNYKELFDQEEGYCIRSNMTIEQLKKRTQVFALRVIRLIQVLPSHSPAHTVGQQLLRCGTSVGANYRSACRARSQADFIAKLKIVEEECDESIYWMELLTDMRLDNASSIACLIKEANEILSITVASIKTARSSTRHS